MQFIVPQHITGEARIVGPLTFRQFGYIGGAGFICLISYFVFPFFIFALIALILGGAALALAFLKISHTPVPTVLKNFFAFAFKPRIYLWHKKTLDFKKPAAQAKKIIKEKPGSKKKQLPLTKKSALHDLSTQLDIKK